MLFNTSKIGSTMSKSKKLDRKSDSQNHLLSLRNLSSNCTKVCIDAHNKKKVLEKKEWEDAECSVCLEFPHNAVLLLCSSYEKGCRPFMCATSDRYSNCLDQYTKAATNRTSKSCQVSGYEVSGLSCPLCRGQVNGWTVVEPARSYLNGKKRACVHDGCSFVGRYKELRKHVKSEHPQARPWDVDPSHAKKWKKLENERDYSDVISTITSTMPGAIVIGDYVIEDYDSHDDDDQEDDMTGFIFRDPSYEQWDTRARGVGHGGSFDRRNHPPQPRVGLLAPRRRGRARGSGTASTHGR